MDRTAVSLLLCAAIAGWIVQAQIARSQSSRQDVGAANPPADIPLPRARPGAQNGADVPAEEATPREPPPPSECFVRLTAMAAVTQLPDVADANGCGFTDAVRLEGVLLGNQRRVLISPPATLRCSMATAIANWVRDDLAFMAPTLGAPLAGIDNYDSYECRGRNRVAGAKLSE